MSIDTERRWAAAMVRARQGDATGYQAFLSEVADELRGLTRRRLLRAGLNRDDAEDVLQEILLAIHTRHATWDAGKPLLPWIHAIARYKTVDAVRRHVRERGARVDVPLDDFEAAPAPADDRPAFQAMYAALDRLPQRQQHVVRAVALGGASARAVAGELNTTEGAVRVMLHRTIASLRTRLAGDAS